MAEDSEGDSIPFGIRLCWQSLVCYTFIREPAEKYSSVYPVEAQAAVLTLRREKVASVMEADNYIGLCHCVFENDICVHGVPMRSATKVW